MNPIRAILFDAYGTLFDVYSVAVRAEQSFPGKGEALAALWRDKQIEYSRLLTLCGRYKPFWDLTEDALRFSLRKLRLIESEATVRLLMQEYACLSAFPENLQCLRRLKAHGLPLGILSNGNPAMLEVAIRSSGMQGLFDHVLSADTVRKFKTAPEVYALGPQATGLAARDILFVSSNAWDACCATWFGYSTFWINRADAPPENLGVAPTATGPNMRELLRFLAVSDSPSN